MSKLSSSPEPTVAHGPQCSTNQCLTVSDIHPQNQEAIKQRQNDSRKKQEKKRKRKKN